MSDLSLLSGAMDFGMNIVDIAPKEKIHIRFQMNGKRAITLVEGLDEAADMKLVVKKMKAKFSCAVSLHADEASGKHYVKLQGDHRDAIKEWLVKEKLVNSTEAKERIVIHGY